MPRIARYSNDSLPTIGGKALSAEIVYLSADEAVALHNELLNAGDVDPESAVRDWNLLESAVARPRTAAYYEGANLARQAATLLWGLVENHPFYDGNKRTGWVAMRTFLLLSGQAITAAEDDSFNLVIAVTQGLSVDEVDVWLRARIVPAA